MNRGVTLIELLVVVLIIGILAAIALPQYTKAVERSRMSEAIQVLGDLATAQSIYYMQNNTFANGWTGTGSIADGDVTISNPSATGKWTVTVTGTNSLATMEATRNAGMYNTGKLTLTVEPNGAIHKTCTNPTGKTEFCGLAAAAGYTTASGTGTGTGTGTGAGA